MLAVMVVSPIRPRGRYDPLVRAVVGAYRMQEADNQDAIQNTWLRVIERLHALRDPNCLAAWLVTIARRECLALLARARRERPCCDSTDNLADPAIGPEATILLAEAYSGSTLPSVVAGL
jgi:DNA-directed RNA polymerase specialized sigma24 family protein